MKCFVGSIFPDYRFPTRLTSNSHAKWPRCALWWSGFSSSRGHRIKWIFFVWSTVQIKRSLAVYLNRCSSWPVQTRASTRSYMDSCGGLWKKPFYEYVCWNMRVLGQYFNSHSLNTINDLLTVISVKPRYLYVHFRIEQTAYTMSYYLPWLTLIISTVVLLFKSVLLFRSLAVVAIIG